MMVSALERAGDDSGAPKLLQRAEAIHVLRGAWSYGDPGRETAREAGVREEKLVYLRASTEAYTVAR